MNLEDVLSGIPESGARMVDLTAILGPPGSQIRALLQEARQAGKVRVEGKGPATRYFRSTPQSEIKDPTHPTPSIPEGTPEPPDEDLASNTDRAMFLAQDLAVVGEETFEKYVGVPPSADEDEIEEPSLVFLGEILSPSKHVFSDRGGEMGPIHDFILRNYEQRCGPPAHILEQAMRLSKGDSTWTVLELADALADLAQWGRILVRKDGSKHFFSELAPN